MRLKYYNKVMALTLIVLLMLQGCTSNDTKKNDGKYSKLKKNIIIGFDRKGVKYYNFDDLNEVLYKEEDTIDVLYNDEPLVVVNIKKKKNNNNYMNIYTKDNIITLDDFRNYSNIKLSDTGRYLGYYGYNDEEVIDGLKIFDIETREEKEIPSEYIISGDNYSIIENYVYFYGVHNQGNKAALYKYNIKEDKVEERDINVDGIIVYYKVVKDLEIILTFDGTNYNLDIYRKDKKIISRNDFVKVEDFLYINNKYYVVGVAKDDRVRIYEIISSDEKRTMTFDFPRNIYSNKGITYDNDNIYFVGGDNDLNENRVYKLNIESREVTLCNSYFESVKVR